MLKNFTLKNEQLNAFCQKWQIIEFALFGSVLRDDFKPESDVDIIITFAPKSKKNLFDLMHVQDELQQLLNRNVDVFTKKSVQDCHN
ncbi:MAG: DNA polymerase subunit beta [Anaerolineaceae bacterium 4572_78]|nr:MAG: DNA polymerase subunit beta [Anaerolineaceae bacterium 4572_78]